MASTNGIPLNGGFIYVFGEKDNRVIKVGRSSNPRKRIAQHAVRGPDDSPMTFLAAVRSAQMQSDETALITALQAHRYKRAEWIDAEHEDVRGWLRWMRMQPFVAVSEDELNTIPVVDAQDWLPGQERYTWLQPRLNFASEPWADLDVSEITEGDYYTHVSITAAARIVMGAIDLDPASCREANKGVQASTFYGVAQDGLQQDWHGRVWLNPPFGQWDLWVPKLLEELNSGRVKEAFIYATANAATAQQFHPLVRVADAMVVSDGRLNCWGPKATAAREGCFIFYAGTNASYVGDAFASIGSTFLSGSRAAPEDMTPNGSFSE